MTFSTFNIDLDTTDATHRVAWALCQIIDDDAPLHWTRYLFVAKCIATNAELMADLNALAQEPPA